MSEARFVIYATGECSFCKRAIDLLKMKKRNFDVRFMENMTSGGVELLKRIHPTVPIIFYDYGTDDPGPRFIGGYTELLKELSAA